jgi:hypothetical protein
VRVLENSLWHSYNTKGNNLKTFAVAMLVVSLSGCATSKPVQGPNGNQAYFIKCGSAAIDACYEEAAKVCPQGYDMADRQANPNAMIAPVGNSFMVVHGPKSMLIECKK